MPTNLIRQLQGLVFTLLIHAAPGHQQGASAGRSSSPTPLHPDAPAAHSTIDTQQGDRLNPASMCHALHVQVLPTQHMFHQQLQGGAVTHLDDWQRQKVAAGVNKQTTVLEARQISDACSIDQPQGALGVVLLVALPPVLLVLPVAVAVVPPPQQRIGCSSNEPQQAH